MNSVSALLIVQVGTALVQPDEPEPTKGRLLVLQYGGGRVALVAGRRCGDCIMNSLSYRFLIVCLLFHIVYLQSSKGCALMTQYGRDLLALLGGEHCEEPLDLHGVPPTLSPLS